MGNGEKLAILGKLDDRNKEEIAELFVHELREKYPDIEGELYLGYPIYIDEVTKRNVCIDIALVSIFGVYIFNILRTPVTDYGLIQDDIFAKIESKFRRNPYLFKRRKLIFDFHVVTYGCREIRAIDDYPIVYSVSQMIDYISESKLKENFQRELYNKILSGIQEAYGINNYVERGELPEGTKAYAIAEMNKMIEKYDIKQMDAILSDTEGIQRIRGMAGSGKTIVLARKAVELHTAHPDWDIVVTYSTRTLKDQLVHLIGKFYALRNDGAKYNEKKLRVMQAWGASSAPGVYYEICLRHGISPLNFTEAKRKYGGNVFSSLCGDLLSEVEHFQKLYDCILIDEAQDFDKNFLLLCLNVLSQEKRLVYAYDELQSLNEESMPNPRQIFGVDIENDTPLTVCYRNQGNAIVTAHAIGMGLYRKEGLIQLPGSSSVWEAIGYFSDRPIVEGQPVALFRTKETSPEFLHTESSEIINFYCYDHAEVMYRNLLDMIQKDITEDFLLPTDIMIIDMDSLSYQTNRVILTNIKNEAYYSTIVDDCCEKRYSFNIHTAGAVHPEDFFREDSIVFSSVRRAKGNESFMVYIVNAQKCVNSIQRRSERNALFTAITRSKGWVRVLGYGEDMKALNAEFELIKLHEYKLFFDSYPNEDMKRLIYLNNRDVTDSEAKSFDSTKKLITKLTKEGTMSKLQLMQQLFDMSPEELLKELTGQSDK